MKELIIKKLTSRKFISIFLVEVTGILTLVLGASSPVTAIAGSALAIVAAVVYCITEGKVDATALQTTATENLALVMNTIASASGADTTEESAGTEGISGDTEGETTENLTESEMCETE